MTALAEALKIRLARDGPISVGAYMRSCLLDPEHGYYRHREVLGRAGDFITAPEISQVFGELIGLWVVATWQAMGRPTAFDLVELGPGRGTLMADALRAMRVVPAARAAARIMLVEASDKLREQQARVLAASQPPPTWCGLDEIASGVVPAIVIANEFLDAVPVEQAVWSKGRWQHRLVGLDGDRLAFVTDPQRPVPGAIVPSEAAPGEGAVFEWQDWSELAGVLGARAAQAPLAALFVDYGHEAPALGETLQAVRGHRYEAVFDNPGEADLSCHVDFSAFARACITDGSRLVSDGLSSQAQFLGRLGAVERAQRLMTANPGKALTIEHGVARLLAANGMGDRFKVIGLRRDDLPKLPAF
jgi:SAM-dependent MidA family methyltransferase